MVIIKNSQGQYFDLPKDYVIEATRTSPLFSGKGPQTVPITFPPTGNNRLLTAHPHRTDRAARPEQKDRVIIESGPVSQSGLLSIQTASPTAITASIGWDESEMYASMNKTQLPALPNLPVFTAAAVDADLDARRNAMLAHLHGVAGETIQADYAVFPVILKQEEIEDGAMAGTYLELVNDTYTSTIEETGQSTNAGGAIGPFRAGKDRIITRVIDGKAVPFEAPKAYGITPFIRIWRILELIFDAYGFTLENNPFREHPQLQKLVALNNTIDAVLTGRINYKDMMPDVTAEQFLEALKSKFGLLYFVNSNTSSIHFDFIRDIFDIENRDEIDITPYKTEEPAITYKENKQLKLTPNNEIEGTKPSHDTYEQFLETYNYQFKDVFGDFAMIGSKIRQYFLTWARRYVCISFLPSGSMYAYETLSSDFFNWDRRDDMGYEEIKASDLSLHMFYGEITNQPDIPSKPPVDYQAMLVYPVDFKHNYSNASVGGKLIENEQPKAKLAFAFSWGKGRDANALDRIYSFAFASQDNRDWHGRPIPGYDLSLYIQHEDGLYNRFWKNYDAWLRHSAHEVNITLKLNEPQLEQLKPWRKIMIDNQLYILEELRYQMGNNVKPAELKLRTLRLYEPNDLPSEQHLASYTSLFYYWREVNVKDDNIEEQLRQQGIPYTRDGFHSDDFMHSYYLVLIAPPTREQYEAQETIVYTITYRVQWQQNGTQTRTVNSTTTYYPDVIT